MKMALGYNIADACMHRRHGLIYILEIHVQTHYSNIYSSLAFLSPAKPRAYL